jgi:hypothetical protein
MGATEDAAQRRRARPGDTTFIVENLSPSAQKLFVSLAQC